MLSATLMGRKGINVIKVLVRYKCYAEICPCAAYSQMLPFWKKGIIFTVKPKVFWNVKKTSRKALHFSSELAVYPKGKGPPDLQKVPC